MNRSARRSSSKRPRCDRNADSRPPMLVMRGIRNDEIEVRERMAVEAFALGYATAEHFDYLADMHGLMILAGCTSEKRRHAATYAKTVLGPVLLSIKSRYLDDGKFSCLKSELDVLRGFVSRYKGFWMNQPTELFIAAVKELQEHNDRIIDKRIEAEA